MYNKEEIVFELIIADLLKRSRTTKNWQRWLNKGILRKKFNDPLIQRLKNYWSERYEKNNANKNFINLVWRDWKIKNGITPENALISHQRELNELKNDPNASIGRIKLLEMNIHHLKKNIEKNVPIKTTVNIDYPSVTTMAQTFAESIVQWAKKGFKVVNEEQFNERLSICRGCDFFDEKALNGSGRCRECGCSTQAKLRIATERCPKDKWVQV